MNIYNQLNSCIDTLQGDFVIPKNAYEKRFCDIIGWVCKDNRFYDAVALTKELIEIKKGQAQMWFDLVRYAEIVKGTGEQNTYTVFLKWNKKLKLIEECYIIRTNDLIEYFDLDMDDWEALQRIDKKLPRRLNAQASLTHHDMKRLALYIVRSSWQKKKDRSNNKKRKTDTEEKIVNRAKKKIRLLKESLSDINERASIAMEENDTEREQAEYFKANEVLEQIEIEESIII